MADGNSEFHPSVKNTKVSRRDFLKLAGSGAALAAVNAVAPIFPPESNFHQDIQKGVLEPTEMERNPMEFPEWGLPLFKPLWPYMDEIGRIFSIDPKLIMGYMAMESKGNMFAVSSGNAHGLMQTLITPSEGWMRELKNEKRFPQIVESLRKIGINIADANGNPYPIVVNDTDFVKSGENNLHSLFSMVIGTYKLARDYQGERDFNAQDKAFLAQIPDNPTTHPSFARIKKDIPRIVVYYLGGGNDLYVNSVTGHIAPLNPQDPGSLSNELLSFYNSGRIMGQTRGGLDGSIKAAIDSQQEVAAAQNKWVEENNPKAQKMDIPSVEKVQDEWTKVQEKYNLVH